MKSLAGLVSYNFLKKEEVSSKDVSAINHLLGLLTTRPARISTAQLIGVCSGSKLLVARNSNEEIVGMATLVTVNIPTGRSGRLEDVVVDDKYRGEGMGKTLIIKLISEAKKLKLKRIDLTSNSKRVEANKLYRSLGFEFVRTNLYRLKI